ncbi:hypothetical protein QQS21_004167 [Conoideocrella luteorostrata]|uniref:Pentatricopeptide repeat domain-containing protein n=1 Tax=Conoideocrella luteorostrata TaxID=1105319 RepID=A0AAJ0CRZ6_9HYPO|nr:hypothetical protein QQS21_004167 [Conoideocrella luteorostrata]
MSLGIKSIWRTGSRGIGKPRIYPPWTCSLRSGIPVHLFSSRINYQSYGVHEERKDHDLGLTPRPEFSAAADPIPQVRAKIVQTKHARNTFLRNAFRETSPAIEEAVERKRSSPYVPTVRDYPSSEATRSSKNHAAKIARVQVGFDLIWESFDQRVPDWTETFNLLKRMTPKRSEGPSMTAVRVVLPSSWDMAMRSKRIEFLDATTGLATKLRVSADHQNSSAIILRGENSVLAKAADELIRACPDVEIFKLGDVDTFDYMAKRLWPSIDSVSDVGLSSPPSGKQDGVWLHRDIQTYWIDRPYEKTPKPNVWTKDSFETYITALVCGKLRSHLALQYYRQPRQDGRLIDTDGIRVGLILGAFEDPLARECITPSVLKMAIAFLSQKGGHRASADRLVTLAEKWGLPMDTEVFNIVLEGYAFKRDAAFFHRCLQKMEMRYFHPNARTWLHFLTLVQRDDQRRQIIAAMYEIGLFEDPATRRGIAQIMASYDSYAAFKAGKSLELFMADQTMRYGEDWFTGGALNPILKEFFRFHDRSATSLESFGALMMRQYEDGRTLEISTIHTILETCLENKDWTTALWTLSHMHQHFCRPNHRTYSLLTSLAFITKAPSSLGVIVFYGILERKLREAARKPLQAILLKRLLTMFPVKIFSKKMARLLKSNKIAHESAAVAGVEWAILSSCEGYKPVKSLAAALDVTWRTIDQPASRVQNPADVTTPDYAVRMRDVKGQRPQIVVHLDAAFNPDTMVRKVDSEKDKEERTSNVSQQFSELSATVTTAPAAEAKQF